MGLLKWNATVVAASLAVTVALSGCVSTGERPIPKQNVAAESSINPYPDSAHIRTIFYRVADSASAATNAAPINVYINGHYQASLIGNSYSENWICPGTVKLVANIDDVAVRYVTKEAGMSYPINAGSTNWFEVRTDANNVTTIRATAKPVGSDSLRYLQAHTISRAVPAACAAN